VTTLEQILQRLGAAGVLGLGVLVFCVLFYISGVLPVERELTSQQMTAERVKARAPVQLASAGDQGEELRRFYASFPAVDELPAELERVYALARDASLQIQQAEYRLEPRGAALLAYRVTFPIRGTYGQIRQFVSAILRDMPIASIDALSFERKSAGDAQLETQVRLTIHFRAADEANYGFSGSAEEGR
jgi:Tfp pilus assembly protein PilO